MKQELDTSGRRGWIVNTASILGLVGLTGGAGEFYRISGERAKIAALRAVDKWRYLTYQAFVTPAAYCASKGAVVNLTRQVAVDYAKDRIHCNAICPGCKFVSFSNCLASAKGVQYIIC